MNQPTFLGQNTVDVSNEVPRTLSGNLCRPTIYATPLPEGRVASDAPLEL
jgi:hypothetical protein